MIIISSSPWIWKGVSTTSHRARYTLSYSNDRNVSGLYPQHGKLCTTSKWKIEFSHPVVLELNTRRLSSVVSMLGHRLRRWPSIETTFDKRLVFAGICLLPGSHQGYYTSLNLKVSPRANKYQDNRDRLHQQHRQDGESRPTSSRILFSNKGVGAFSLQNMA